MVTGVAHALFQSRKVIFIQAWGSGELRSSPDSEQWALRQPSACLRRVTADCPGMCAASAVSLCPHSNPLGSAVLYSHFTDEQAEALGG